jgi:hypothetical protein
MMGIAEIDIWSDTFWNDSVEEQGLDMSGDHNPMREELETTDNWKDAVIATQ